MHSFGFYPGGIKSSEIGLFAEDGVAPVKTEAQWEVPPAWRLLLMMIVDSLLLRDRL